jgi:hypothetical protein
VKGVQGNVINFNYGGKNGKVFDGLTVRDAKWLSSWLGRLSDEQIKDAFRAANYSAEDVEQLAGAVRKRIEALTRLSTNVAAK